MSTTEIMLCVVVPFVGWSVICFVLGQMHEGDKRMKKMIQDMSKRIEKDEQEKSN